MLVQRTVLHLPLLLPPVSGLAAPFAHCGSDMLRGLPGMLL